MPDQNGSDAGTNHYRTEANMRVFQLLNEAVPVEQREEFRTSLEMLKNLKVVPIDLQAFTIDPAMLTRVW